MTGHRSRRHLLWLTAILFGTLAMLAVLVSPSLQPNSILARSLKSRAERAPDSQVRKRLERMTLLGDAGLEALVEAMASQRSIVADGASSILDAELDRWQMLGARHASPKVAKLAEILAKNAGTRGQNDRGASRDLAIRILLWPIDRQAIDSAKLVSDCEAILRGTVARTSNSESASPRQPAPDDHHDPSTFSHTATDLASSPTPSIALPGGGLPVRIAEIPQLSRVTTESADVDIGNEPLLDVPRPRRFIPPPAAVPTGSQNGLETGPSAKVLPGASATRTDESLGREIELRQLSDISVIQQMASDDPAKARRAETELKRRRFLPRQLDLARRLVDPDSQVRLDLVDALPRIPGVEPVRWLLWLCRDPDPLVRKAAITVIAATNDPSLRGRLFELEQEESDPAVLRLLRSVLYPSRTR
ncbi:MAG: HEAT repeat domain-containing protein [Pirellulaceae bacterium]